MASSGIRMHWQWIPRDAFSWGTVRIAGYRSLTRRATTSRPGTNSAAPSGLYIDENDVLYATDSESNAGRNKGWLRGIYIGDARTGWVTHFIPDPEPDPDSSGTSGAEGIAVDRHGHIYGAEVGPRQMRKYVKR